MKNTTGTNEKVTERTRKTIRARQIVIVGVIMAGLVTSAAAGPREQAKRIHDRLAGVPPTDQVLQVMENQITSGDPVAAAYTAMDNRYFYSVTLKNFAAPWTNRDQSVFVPLNDYIATVIGMVRDDIDFSTLLSADIGTWGDQGSFRPHLQRTTTTTLRNSNRITSTWATLTTSSRCRSLR